MMKTRCLKGHRVSSLFAVCLLSYCQLVAESSEPVFTVSPTPPAGFAFLNQEQTTLVDVYYDGRLLTSSVARFTLGGSSIEFLDPEQLTSQLSDVKASEKMTLLGALSAPLATNNNLICNEKQPIPVCSLPASTQVASVVFNERSFRVDLFLAPKILAPSVPLSHFIPGSTAGLAFDDNITFNLGGSTSSQRPTTNNYSLSQAGALSYASARVNYALSYSTRGGTDNSGDSGRWQVNELNSEWDYKRITSQAGYIDSEGNTFISDQSILGVGVETSLRTLRKKFQSGIYGTPLIVFLNLPSQVAIYRDQQLLSSRSYPAGQQDLDTSTLPTGAYQITLRIEDNLGNVREETRFFVKSQQIPPRDYPLYFAKFGYLTARNGSATNNLNQVLPELRPIPIYQAGMSRRIEDSWGLLSGVLGSNDNAYLNTGFFFLLPFYNLQIVPEALFGTNSDYGVGVDGRASIGRVYLNIDAVKLWAKDNNAANVTPHDSVFDPLATSQSRVTGNIGFPIERVRFSFLGQWRQQQGRAANYSYGLTSNATLIRAGSTSVALSVSLTRSDSDHLLALAVLRINHFAKQFYNNVSLGYQHSEASRENSGGLVSAQSRWQQHGGARQGWALGAGVDKRPGSQSVTGDVSHFGRYAYVRGDVAYSGQSGREIYNFDQRFSSLRYNARASTRLVWVNSGLPYIGANENAVDKTGSIIYIRSKTTGQPFEVLANQRPVAVINTNSATPITLDSYQIHRLSIRNVGKTFFDYDNNAQEVVLYPGNYQYLEWQANPVVVIVTRIVHPDGKPLVFARVGKSMDYTDEQGFIQLEAAITTRHLVFATANKQSCEVTLPDPLPVAEGFASINDLTCYPVTIPKA